MEDMMERVKDPLVRQVLEHDEGLRVMRDEPEVEDVVSVVRQVLSICTQTVSNNSLVKFLH